MQAGIAGFWQGVRRQTIDPAWWQDRMGHIGADAQEALTHGAVPESPEVQAIVQEWLEFFATVSQKEVTEEFMRTVAEQAHSWIAGRSPQLTDALLELSQGKATSTFAAIEALLLAGLAWRIAQIDSRKRETMQMGS